MILFSLEGKLRKISDFKYFLFQKITHKFHKEHKISFLYFSLSLLAVAFFAL